MLHELIPIDREMSHEVLEPFCYCLLIPPDRIACIYRLRATRAYSTHGTVIPVLRVPQKCTARDEYTVRLSSFLYRVICCRLNTRHGSGIVDTALPPKHLSMSNIERSVPGSSSDKALVSYLGM